MKMVVPVGLLSFSDCWAPCEHFFHSVYTWQYIKVFWQCVKSRVPVAGYACIPLHVISCVSPLDHQRQRTILECWTSCWYPSPATCPIGSLSELVFGLLHWPNKQSDLGCCCYCRKTYVVAPHVWLGLTTFPKSDLEYVMGIPFLTSWVAQHVKRLEEGSFTGQLPNAVHAPSKGKE